MLNKLILIASTSLSTLSFATLPAPAALEVDEGQEEQIDYDFRGIVALNNCSGSLVRFEDSLDEDNGMILTNGHCVRMITPGTAMADQFSFRSFTILDENAGRLGTVRASHLIYATMTGTDMALYQLRDSYQDIIDRFGIEPLTLSSEKAQIDDEIEIISGYWKGYSCNIEAAVYQLQK